MVSSGVVFMVSSGPPQGSMVRPGFGFMRDGASLAMLREMLVMIRIWGLLKPGCLPTFTATSDNQDSMQLLFRLLTKLWLCCKAPPSVLLIQTDHFKLWLRWKRQSMSFY